MNKWKRNPRVFNGEYITVTPRSAVFVIRQHLV